MLQCDTQTAVSQLQLFCFTSRNAKKQFRVERLERVAECRKGEIYKYRREMKKSQKVSSFIT